MIRLACLITLPLVLAITLLLGRPSREKLPREHGSVLSTPSNAQIDQAVKRGLRWLAQQQTPQGSWVADVGHKREDSYLLYGTAEDQREARSGHVGVTSLAGLAFLADGHVPKRGEHGSIVEAATEFVLRAGAPHDFIMESSTRMYSHSFGVLFLSQVHGMTNRRAVEVEERLRGATRFIVQHQNRHGGWRYMPGMDEEDLSVTVCQVQALRAARNAGILVPSSTIDRVLDYIRQSRIPSGRLQGCFFYKIHGRSARTKTSFAINGAAVTALHSAGVYDQNLYAAALDFIEDGYEEVSRYYPTHFYYWYGNYYGAQALHLEGGIRWERYWAKLTRDLVARQLSDGSWENDVGPGRAFATAVACLVLRIPAGLLPIFEH